MTFSEISIGYEARNWFFKNTSLWCDLSSANRVLKELSGIESFFDSELEMNELRDFFSDEATTFNEPDRTEYGDFQTNLELAKRVAAYVGSQKFEPEIVLEPTFGKGNFILAALHQFPNLEKIVGFEIYKPYVFEAKFAVLDWFLRHPKNLKPEIQLIHADVFDVDFQRLKLNFLKKKLLVLGNPPWVTSAHLSALNSTNLPTKSNFKKLDGFAAITGKSNFDLGEFITLRLLSTFQKEPGGMAFLVKDAVVKNVVEDQRRSKLTVGDLEKHPIDAKKEFGAAVEACLFWCRFNLEAGLQCAVKNFSEENHAPRFGWVGANFVSNVEQYLDFQMFDGVCPFEWRQGLKHDCSLVMEMERQNGHFQSAVNPQIFLEDDLVFGLLKSSDLKGGAIDVPRKFTIVTQKKIGQDTRYIAQFFPKTFRYLDENHALFAARKSSIYQGKPPFSIFGIGDYSFQPYKIAISGLYKNPVFTLVLPQNGKPLMLDDTCYFIGFQEFGEAVCAFALLNSTQVRGLLSAITFPEAKRMFNKDVLMRIDLAKVADSDSFENFRLNLPETLAKNLDLKTWQSFQKKLVGSAATQLQLF